MRTFKINYFKDSGVLNVCIYYTERKDLLVIFRSKAQWLYKQVPESVYKEFIEAPSSGKYFNQNIRDTYVSRCLFKKGDNVVKT